MFNFIVPQNKVFYYYMRETERGERKREKKRKREREREMGNRLKRKDFMVDK